MATFASPLGPGVSPGPALPRGTPRVSGGLCLPSLPTLLLLSPSLSHTNSHLAPVPRSQEHIQMASDHLLREAPHCKRTHHTGKPRLLGISPHFILQYIHMSSCISKVIRLALLVTNHTTNLASETGEGIHISASFPVPLPKTRTAERDLHRKPHSSVRPDRGVYGTSTELCSPLGCPTATSLCLLHSAPRPWEGRSRQQGAVLLQRNARPL